MDLETHAERLESELDALVERRAREAVEQERIEIEWAASERRDRERRRREHREQWRAFHEHMRELHEGLAGEHAERAAALLGEEVER